MDLFKQLISFQNVFDALNANLKENSQNSKTNVLNANNAHFVDAELFANIFGTKTHSAKNKNKSKSNSKRKENQNEHAKQEVSTMKKLLSLTRKKRAFFFKSHPREL